MYIGIIYVNDTSHFQVPKVFALAGFNLLRFKYLTYLHLRILID